MLGFEECALGLWLRTFCNGRVLRFGSENGENGEVTPQICEIWVAGLVAGGFGLGAFGWRWEGLEPDWMERSSEMEEFDEEGKGRASTFWKEGMSPNWKHGGIDPCFLLWGCWKLFIAVFREVVLRVLGADGGSA